MSTENTVRFAEELANAFLEVLDFNSTQLERGTETKIFFYNWVFYWILNRTIHLEIVDHSSELVCKK